MSEAPSKRNVKLSRSAAQVWATPTLILLTCWVWKNKKNVELELIVQPLMKKWLNKTRRQLSYIKLLQVYLVLRLVKIFIKSSWGNTCCALKNLRTLSFPMAKEIRHFKPWTVCNCGIWWHQPALNNSTSDPNRKKKKKRLQSAPIGLQWCQWALRATC